MSQVSLPSDIRALAERRAKQVGAADLEDYVARLIQLDAADTEDGDLETMLLEGMEGPDLPLDLDAMWDEAMSRVARKG